MQHRNAPMPHDTLQIGHADRHPEGPGPVRRDLAAVGDLARQVVSVLNERQARKPAAARPHIRGLLERRLLGRGLFDPADMAVEMRGYRLRDETIIDVYIPAAAREVGRRWTVDEMGFAEVTVAAVRLHSLLSELVHGAGSTFGLTPDPARVLMVIGERDQHTLGGFVASAQLRRAGAIVDICCNEPWDVVAERAGNTAYDAVLFSCSRVDALASIEQAIKQVKIECETPPAFVLGGIVLKACGDMRDISGIDLMTNDVAQVLDALRPARARPSC